MFRIANRLRRFTPRRPVLTSGLPSALFNRGLQTRAVPDCRYFVPQEVRGIFLRALNASTKVRLSDLPYIPQIPEGTKYTAAVASDGAGSSGDKGGKGTKVAMANACFDLLRERNITWDEKLYNAVLAGINNYMGSGKLHHFTNIEKDLAAVNPALHKRYLDEKSIVQDANLLVKKLGKEGVRFIEQYSSPVPGFEELADYLKLIGVILGLQSAYSEREVIAFKNKMLEGGVKFAVTISSSDVKNSRPAPDMLLEFCRQLDVYPHQVLAVGDTIYDMWAALLAGCIPVGAPNFSALLKGDLNTMTPQQLLEERSVVADILRQNGAAYVLFDNNSLTQRSLKEMMAEVIAHHDRRLITGVNPYVSPDLLLAQIKQLTM